MKRILHLIVVFISSSLIGVAGTGIFASFATAQNQSLSNVGNALAYPTSSETFFEEGSRQLEREIQHLRPNSTPLTYDLLKIEPAVFQQQPNGHEQEPQLLDGINSLPSRTDERNNDLGH